MTRALRLAVSQAVLEQRSFWRSAEYALFTIAFPLMILLLIGAARRRLLPARHAHQDHHRLRSGHPGLRRDRRLVREPRLEARGVRHDGVLKRIRTTPLPSVACCIGGLLASTVVTAGFITACTGLIGWLAFGAVPLPRGLLVLAGSLTLGIASSPRSDSRSAR